MGIAWLGQLSLGDLGSKIWYIQNICYQIHFLAFKHCRCLLPHFLSQILWNLRSNLYRPLTMKSWLAGQSIPSESQSWLDANQILKLWPRHTQQSVKKVQGEVKSEHALLQIEIPSRAGFRTEKFPLLKPELDLSSKCLELQGGFLTSVGLKFDQWSYPGDFRDFFSSTKSK